MKETYRRYFWRRLYRKVSAVPMDTTLIFLLLATFLVTTEAVNNSVLFYKASFLGKKSSHLFNLTNGCNTFPSSLNEKLSAVNGLGNCIILYELNDCLGRSIKVPAKCEDGNSCCDFKKNYTKLSGSPCNFGAIASSVRFCEPKGVTKKISTTTMTTTSTPTRPPRRTTTTSQSLTTMTTLPPTINSSSLNTMELPLNITSSTAILTPSAELKTTERMASPATSTPSNISTTVAPTSTARSNSTEDFSLFYNTTERQKETTTITSTLAPTTKSPSKNKNRPKAESSGMYTKWQVLLLLSVACNIFLAIIVCYCCYTARQETSSRQERREISYESVSGKEEESELNDDMA